MLTIGLGLIFGNLLFPHHWNADPMDSSKFGNAVYYGFSRLLFVLGAHLILLTVISGHASMIKAFLSTSNMRFLAKAVPCASLIVILVMQCLFESNATPQGLYLVFMIANMFGLGFVLVSLVISSVLIVFVEFPIRRIF